jgi:hypothetical protein
MAEMGMKNPANSLPMIGGPGPYDYINMGGMFNLLKVRAELPGDGSDPGWYPAPAGTVATVAPEADLRRDGIVIPTAGSGASRMPQATTDPVCQLGQITTKS